MDESYEERAIRLLLQPSIHLTLVLRHISDEGKNTIIHHLANDSIQELIDFVNETIETVDKVMGTVKDDIDEYQRYFMLQLQLRLFINELRESYAIVRDLLYHKDDSNAMNILNIVNQTLQKYNVDNYQQIGAEIYSHIVSTKNTPSSKKLTLEQKAEQAFNKQIVKDNTKLKPKK